MTVDGWQRTWDLRSPAQQPPADPPPPSPPKPLPRQVNRRGCISINRYLYYLGISWAGQTVTVQREEQAWSVSLPDGSTKTLPCKHLVPQPHRQPTPPKPKTPPSTQPEPVAFQTRRVTKTGQIAFHHRLYDVGIAYKGTMVHVAPTPEGLSVYNMDHAWITACPWKQLHPPDKPICPLHRALTEWSLCSTIRMWEAEAEHDGGGKHNGSMGFGSCHSSAGRHHCLLNPGGPGGTVTLAQVPQAS